MKRISPKHLSVTHAQNTQQADTTDTIMLDETPTLTVNVGTSLLSLFSQHYQGSYGIGIVEWRVMTTLATAPDSRLKTICVALAADKGGVSRALGKLREKGLITGEKDQWHTCRRYWHLTPAGLALHDVIFAESQRLNKALLKNIPPDQVSILHQTLQQLQHNMQAYAER